MEAIIEYFLKPENGILGIIIVMLISVIVWQQKRLDNKDKIVNDLQEKRKADTDAYTKSYTDTIKEVIITTKDAVNTTNLLQHSVDSLAQGFQTFINGKQ